MSNDFTGWDSNIIDSLGDESLATGNVISWLEGNLGKLNLMTESSYSLSGDCISPDMNSVVSGIYSEMFICWYLNKQAFKTLGAAGCDWTLMQGEDQGSMRRVSKTDQAKTYKAFAKDCEERLDQLLRWYKIVVPQQTLYNKRNASSYSALECPPCEYYTAYTPIWT